MQLVHGNVETTPSRTRRSRRERSPTMPGVASPHLRRVQWPRERSRGDTCLRACSGRGGGTVRAKSVRMRCTGAWAARSTCRVGVGALGCAAIRAKGGGEKGRAHMDRNARLETRRPRRPAYSSRLVPLRRSQGERTRRANYRPIEPSESPVRTWSECSHGQLRNGGAQVFARVPGSRAVPPRQRG